MHSKYSRYQNYCYQMFFIFITLLTLQACVSPPYVDKNTPDFRSDNRPKTHRVVPGDTLFSIAWRYGFKYQELAKYNGISTPYNIYPGQVIRLDTGSKVTLVGSDKKLPVASNSLSISSAYSKNNRSKYQASAVGVNGKRSLQAGALVWFWPAKGPILKRFAGSSTLEKGIDIGGKLGEPVLAAASGQVVYAGSGLRGYGKLLIVKHNDTFLSAYAHNNSLLVKEGDFVKVGQRIADMGSSGTEGVKLHFEIRRDGNPEDPLKYLPKR